MLYKKKIVSSEVDKVLCKGTKDDRFLVIEAYNYLQLRIVTPFPEKGIWIPCVPTKIAYYAWEAAWGKVLTLDKLQRRGW